MSPEQSRGLAVDKRTDVWAFGCVLFEMLSGRRAFEGKTISDTVAHILEREPDWGWLPVDTPPHIRSLIERCLRKDSRKRLHDIADALIQIDGDATPVESTGSRRAITYRVGWILAATFALAAGAAALFTHRTDSAAPTELVELSIAPPPGSIFSGLSPEFAISPDGRQVAFVASSKAGPSLWIRSLGSVVVRELPGTQGARNPFWRPDSQSVGYFAADKLQAVRLDGGSPILICAAFPTGGPLPPSGTWNDDDVIVFGPIGNVLHRVSAKGGESTALTTTTRPTEFHYWPSFLPDGTHLLYVAHTGATAELRVGSLTSDTALIGPAESHATFAAGHLFFVRGGNLMAQAFEVETRQLRGKPLDLNVQTGVAPAYRGMFSIASSGRVVYLPPLAPYQLTWIDRQGRPTATVGDPGWFINLDLSPDGKRVAASGGPPLAPGARLNIDIWVIDLSTGHATRLTDDPGGEFDPTWSPDGSRIAFTSNRPHVDLFGPFGLFMRASDGTGKDVELVKGTALGWGISNPDWSRQNVLVYNKGAGIGLGADIWTLPMSGTRTPTPFLATRFNERSGTISPDGRMIAYDSDVSGRSEVYVRPFPRGEPALPVSRDGGRFPRWGGDSSEIFFLSPDSSMMVARVDSNTGAPTSDPVRLFTAQLQPGNGNHLYAVDQDGQRFLIPIAPAPEPLRVVLDWRAMIAR
jgi:Tol biopolymer transport system component